MNNKERKRLKKLRQKEREAKKYTVKQPNRWGIKADTFIKKMQLLGYNADDGGVCYGLSSVAVHAVLVDAQPQFEADIYRMRRLQSQEQLGQVQERAFCDAIAFCQEPSHYDFVYAQEGQMYKQAQDILHSLPVVMSTKLQDRGGLVEAAAFTGVYKIAELALCFQLMREKLAEKPYPLAILLSDERHAIAVYYDHIESLWCCVDLRKLPTKKYATDFNLARSVAHALCTDLKYTVISMQCFASGDCADSAREMFTSLKENVQWQVIHNVNPSRKMYFARQLIVSAWIGCLSEVQRLLSHGVNPNGPVVGGFTPLIAASMYGHLAVVRALIDAGADVNHRPADTRTHKHTGALFDARKHGQYEIVQLLMDHGASLNAYESGELLKLHV